MSDLQSRLRAIEKAAAERGEKRIGPLVVFVVPDDRIEAARTRNCPEGTYWSESEVAAYWEAAAVRGETRGPLLIVLDEQDADL